MRKLRLTSLRQSSTKSTVKAPMESSVMTMNNTSGSVCNIPSSPLSVSFKLVVIRKPGDRKGRHYISHARNVVTSSGDPCGRQATHVFPISSKRCGEEKSLLLAVRDYTSVRDLGQTLRDCYSIMILLTFAQENA